MCKDKSHEYISEIFFYGVLDESIMLLTHWDPSYFCPTGTQLIILAKSRVLNLSGALFSLILLPILHEKKFFS